METKFIKTSNFINLTRLVIIAALMSLGLKANSQCNASYTYTNNNNGLLTFTNTSTGIASVCVWNFGDGTSASSFNASHQFIYNGSYAICLTIIDSVNNCSDTFCDSIVIVGANAPCQANFTYSINNGVVTFNNTSTGASSYSWDFGDNSPSSTVANPIHTYPAPGSAPGVYDVWLQTFDATGNQCDSTHAIIIIPGTGPCQASFIYTINNGVVAFTNTSLGNTANYFWSFGDGSSSVAPHPSHQFNNGSYTVCLTVIDSANTCSNTFCDSIVITGSNTVCQAAFTYSINNGVVNFNNTSTGASSYSWDFGDNSASSTVVNPVHTYPLPGIYYVWLQTFDATGNQCDSVQASIIIPGNGPCQASFTYSINNGVVAFTNTSTGNTASYFWSFGDGSSSSAPHPSHQFNNGSYTVCLTIIDSANTCSDTFCDSIVITGGNTPCNAYFVVVPDSSNNYSYEIYEQSTGGQLTYSWDFGDGTTSTLQLPTHTYTGAGPYYVCLTVTNSLTNCTSTYCDSIATTSGALSVIVKSLAASVQELEIVSSLENYPNPFNGSTTIAYELKQDAPVQLTIVDLIGKTVAIVDAESKASGKHSINWNADGITPGMYFIHLKVNNKITTRKIIIAK